MAKKSARKLFVASPNKSLPELYHNPTVAYNPNKPMYNPTKIETSAYVQQLQVKSPGLFQRLVSNGTLRAYAREQLSIHGPAIIEWGVSKIGGYIEGFNGGPSTTIGSPARRTPGGGANQPTTKVFDGKANPVSNTSYALSRAPNPKPISINSGIEPNTFVNDNMPAVENKCSPLHFSLVNLTLPANAANPLNAYFLNTICFDIQTRAQEAVGFSLDITNTLSAANLFSAFNSVIQALNIYFHVSSILSYETDARNNNAGMIALRKRYDAQTLSDYYQLKRRLEDTPCPPRIVQWIRYMNGNFLSSNTQGSPLIKIAHSPSCLTGVIPTTSACATALATLNTPMNTLVFSLLRRCVPKWRIGKLFDVPVIPHFDKNFLTIWANLPAANQPSSTVNVLNSVANVNTAGPYNSYCNNLDGLAFSMGGVYDSVLGTWYPGLVTNNTVSTTYRDSRMSFGTIFAATDFYPVYNSVFLTLSRQESVQVVNGTDFTPHLFGTDKCQNVTGAALLQSGQETLQYLFDTKALKTGKVVKQYN